MVLLTISKEDTMSTSHCTEVLCHFQLKLPSGVNEGASELCKSKRALAHLGLLKNPY
jgi:hypothetical protein